MHNMCHLYIKNNQPLFYILLLCTEPNVANKFKPREICHINQGDGAFGLVAQFLNFWEGVRKWYRTKHRVNKTLNKTLQHYFARKHFSFGHVSDRFSSVTVFISLWSISEVSLHRIRLIRKHSLSPVPDFNWLHGEFPPAGLYLCRNL